MLRLSAGTADGARRRLIETGGADHLVKDHVVQRPDYLSLQFGGVGKAAAEQTASQP